MNLPMDLGDVLLRLAAAAATGFVFGLEREHRGRAAGLRTTTLVCVAATIGMILSQSWALTAALASAPLTIDPGRLAAGILTGMGFLGAGTILRQGNAVRGLTTAAILWYLTILGLAYGSGYLLLGLAGFAIAVVIVFGLPILERRLSVERYASLTLRMQVSESSQPRQELERQIERFGVRVLHIELEYDALQQQRTVRYDLEFRRRKPGEISEQIVQHVQKEPGVLFVKWN